MYWELQPNRKGVHEDPCQSRRAYSSWGCARGRWRKQAWAHLCLGPPPCSYQKSARVFPIPVPQQQSPTVPIVTSLFQIPEGLSHQRVIARKDFRLQTELGTEAESSPVTTNRNNANVSPIHTEDVLHQPKAALGWLCPGLSRQRPCTLLLPGTGLTSWTETHLFPCFRPSLSTQHLYWPASPPRLKKH